MVCTFASIPRNVAQSGELPTVSCWLCRAVCSGVFVSGLHVCDNCRACGNPGICAWCDRLVAPRLGAIDVDDDATAICPLSARGVTGMSHRCQCAGGNQPTRLGILLLCDVWVSQPQDWVRRWWSGIIIRPSRDCGVAQQANAIGTGPVGWYRLVSAGCHRLVVSVRAIQPGV